MIWTKRTIVDFRAIVALVGASSITLLVLTLVALFLGHSDTASANHPGVKPPQCNNAQAPIPITQAAGYAIAAGFQGQEAEVILAIAWAESNRGNPSACGNEGNNPPDSWDRGILQINDHWHSEISNTCAFNPQCAFGEARTINFCEWATYEEDCQNNPDFPFPHNGAYRAFLSDARLALAQVAGIANPTNFKGTAVSQTEIRVTWDDVANEQKYDLWRVPSGGSWQKVATLPANTVTYNDTGLSPETWYKYAIRAYAGSISSGWTYSTWVMTPGSPVAAPSNLRGSAASTTQINVTWQDNASNEQNFDLWRVPSGGSWQKVATLPANTVAYNDSGLSPETWYRYAIRAYRGATSSNWVYSDWIPRENR